MPEDPCIAEKTLSFLYTLYIFALKLKLEQGKL